MEVIIPDDDAPDQTGFDHMPIHEDDSDMDDDDVDDWEDDDPEEDEAAYARMRDEPCEVF